MRLITTPKKFFSELISELEAISEYNDVIIFNEDEIYELADYIMPYIVDQIEKRGNDAIEFYFMNDMDD